MKFISITLFFLFLLGCSKNSSFVYSSESAEIPNQEVIESSPVVYEQEEVILDSRIENQRDERGRNILSFDYFYIVYDKNEFEADLKNKMKVVENLCEADDICYISDRELEFKLKCYERKSEKESEKLCRFFKRQDNKNMSLLQCKKEMDYHIYSGLIDRVETRCR